MLSFPNEISSFIVEGLLLIARTTSLPYPVDEMFVSPEIDFYLIFHHAEKRGKKFFAKNL